jgi:acetylornithine deacetylase/succinyl-diaminopimelate desuccinylase-like protein
MKMETVGGATVAKYLTFKGIPAIVHLPGLSDQFHVPDEHVSVSIMEKGAILYAEMLKKFFED